MPDMTPAQQESVNSLLRMLGAAGLAGGAVRAGYGVLRNANRTYDPPAEPKPLIVDMPYASREAPPPSAIPLPKAMTRAKPGEVKVANQLEDWLKSVGGSLRSALPSSVPVGGHPDAAGPMEVPAYGLAALPTIAAGGAGGYMLADKVLRAADRRGSRKDLDAAQEEYRQAVMNRVTNSAEPKVAADLVKMASDETPENADLRRAKVALDVLFERIKAAEEPSLAANAVKSWLYPGSYVGPEAFTANLALAGVGAGLGGYAGYNASRDSDEASKVRDKIRALDKLNAKQVKPPVIARLVPVAPDRL